MTRILVYSDSDHSFTKATPDGYRVSLLHEQAVARTGADGQTCDPWAWTLTSGAMRTAASSPGIPHSGLLQKTASGVELLVKPLNSPGSSDSSPTYSDARAESPTSVIELQAAQSSVKKSECIQVSRVIMHYGVWACVGPLLMFQGGRHRVASYRC